MRMALGEALGMEWATWPAEGVVHEGSGVRDDAEPG